MPEHGNGKHVDLKLEVVTLPVADLDRALAFYEKLGWRLDANFRKGDERAIQFTPPGSECSVHLALSDSPGTAQSLFLIVSDIDAAREDLKSHGVEVSEVFHFADAPAPFGGIVSGPALNHASYGSLAAFSDPDGNRWLLQEVTTRFEGRVAKSATSFSSVNDLVSALKRAEAAHGEHEKRTGVRDVDWPEWYAGYMAAEQSGATLPT